MVYDKLSLSKELLNDKMYFMNIDTLKSFLSRFTKISLLQKLSILFWTIAVFSYFLQAPFRFLSSLTMPFLFLYLFTLIPNIRIPKNKPILVIAAIYIVYLLFSAVYSLKNGTALTRIVRFLVILYAIPGSFLLEDTKNTEFKSNIFITAATVKASLIMAFSVCMLLMGKYMAFRLWAQESAIGDIYLIGSRPYVQLHGNALLVMAFILEYMNKKKITLPLVLLLIGILCAGNFAFVLGLLAFIGYRALVLIIKLYKQNRLNKKLVLICLIVAGLIFAPYAIKKFSEKMFKSNVIRMDQIRVLTDTNPIIGSGLGHAIHAETTFRLYDAPTYFEMQTFYIYNQIGLVGLILYFGLTLWMAFKKGYNRLILYLIYLFYTFWNPYCFDTTQLFAITVIFSLIGIDREHEKDSDYYFIFSK